MDKNSKKYIIQTVILIGILIIINAIARQVNGFIDLTEDKRFTLTESTTQLLDDVDDIIFIDVLLEGDLTSSFKRLKNRTEEIIKQFRTSNPLVEYRFTNPSQGSIKEINQLRQELSKEGIYPTNLFVTEGSQRVEKLIYPYAIIKYGDRKIPVNLLEAMSKGESEDQALNKSVKLLEYKLASAISKLFKKDQPIIIFTEGQGELSDDQTAKLETDLSSTVITGRINLDSIYELDSKINILIVAKPMTSFSVRDKFIIDQYIMNGGKVIWLIDQFAVNLDSINNYGVYIPKTIEHNLDDIFFKYGIRINKDLILDLENSKIPQVIGMQGGQAQQELFSWVYHPLLQSNSQNPIVKNIDRVSSTFTSSISSLDSPLDLSQSVLLASSRNSRYQVYPMRLSFDILKLEQNRDSYNKSFLPAAVLVEGEFESHYKNRVSEQMNETLKKINSEFKEKSPRTSQIFVGDGDIIKNLYDAQRGRISPIGFNKWEGITYSGNSDFIMNAIDYLLDDYGLIEARSKNIKLRLLDQAKLQSEKLKWQIINVLSPVIIVIFSGLFFGFYRKRKYATKL